MSYLRGVLCALGGHRLAPQEFKGSLYSTKGIERLYSAKCRCGLVEGQVVKPCTALRIPDVQAWKEDFMRVAHEIGDA